MELLKLVMKVIGRCHLILVIIMASVNFLSAKAAQDTLRVLFVGNSYTYYQNLPHIVSLISDSTSVKLITKKSTAGGANLSHHWNGERGLKSKDIIQQGNFDIVVLQDHSLGPIEKPERFHKYAKLFCDLIKASGAQPYFYVTWAREKVPQYQHILANNYSRAAKENGAKVARVGSAWVLAQQYRPQVALYTADGSHPSDLGTYLAACVFVGVLTKSFPENLPLRYYTKDAQGESVELLRMDKLDIQFCTRIAEEVVGRQLLIEE